MVLLLILNYAGLQRQQHWATDFGPIKTARSVQNAPDLHSLCFNTWKKGFWIIFSRLSWLVPPRLPMSFSFSSWRAVNKDLVSLRAMRCHFGGMLPPYSAKVSESAHHPYNISTSRFPETLEVNYTCNRPRCDKRLVQRWQCQWSLWLSACMLTMPVQLMASWWQMAEPAPSDCHSYDLKIPQIFSRIFTMYDVVKVHIVNRAAAEP